MIIEAIRGESACKKGYTVEAVKKVLGCERDNRGRDSAWRDLESDYRGR
jgi:hypothetical protein